MSVSETSIELQPPRPASLVAKSQTSLRDRSEANSQVALNETPQETNFNGDPASNDISRTTTVVVITTVTGVTSSVGALLTGILTVAIPTVARDVHLSDDLLLWPASIYALVCGCTLLISGSLSDVIGSRFTYLLGSFFQAVFSFACGLSRTGTQLIIFRAFTGLAMSFCLPSATSIISTTLPSGKTRNAGFACMGGGQPLGFSFGLILGGVFAQTIGWRWGFYLGAIFNLICFAIAFKGLPKQSSHGPFLSTLRQKLDWVGACLATTCLALLSYVLGAITTNASDIAEPLNVAFLAIAVVLIPAFAWWMHHQVKNGRPALIPNSVWQSHSFTTICLCVFFMWGGFNGLEQILTLYLQYVQELSPIQTSLRFLPEAASGTIAQIVAGLLVHRVAAHYITTVGISLSLAPPLLLVFAKPSQTYWAMEFPAMALQATGADSLYTIANLVTTLQFSGELQGIAGGVFNTVSQIGKSIGLAVSSVVANTVTQHSQYEDKRSPDALLEGYRAAFWFCFALNALTLILSVLGLRKIGKVGIKRD